MRRILAITSVTLALVGLSGCGSDDDPSDAGATAQPVAATKFPLTFSNCGRKVTLQEPPKGVLTIISDSALLMWAAGAADRITKRASEAGSPLGPAKTALADVPQIDPNGDQSLSREVIIGTGADFVISYGLDETPPEDLKAAGINSYTPSWRPCPGGDDKSPGRQSDFDRLFADIELMGRIFSTQDRAAARVTELRERANAVQDRFADVPKRTAATLYVEDGGGYGRASMANTLMEKVGLKNVFADVDKNYFEPSQEELLARDPDVIIAVYGGVGNAKLRSEQDVLPALKDKPGAERLTAVREGRVIPIHSAYLVGGPLAVDGLEAMARALASSE